MRAVTYISGFFMNVGMFDEQQRVWADYPAELKPYFHAIVTDDCSPKGHRLQRKQMVDTGIHSLQAYRTLVKVRWNWLFARNLGVEKAQTDWLLLTDIDHVLTADALRRIVTGDLDPGCVYRLARVDADRRWPYAVADCPVRENKRYHPNTWLMTRAMFDATGGYDERLSGCYGSDGEYKERVQKAARAVVMLPDLMVRYAREVIPDASTTVFTRKNDEKNDGELLHRRNERHLTEGWKPLRVTFPYEHIATIEAAAEVTA